MIYKKRVIVSLRQQAWKSISKRKVFRYGLPRRFAPRNDEFFDLFISNWVLGDKFVHKLGGGYDHMDTGTDFIIFCRSGRWVGI